MITETEPRFSNLTFRIRVEGSTTWIFGTWFLDPKQTVYKEPRQHSVILRNLDRSTLGESTGCRDANGTLIFEGDWLRFLPGQSGTWDGSTLYEVIWSQGQNGLTGWDLLGNPLQKSGTVPQCLPLFTQTVLSRMVRCGNRFDGETDP